MILSYRILRFCTLLFGLLFGFSTSAQAEWKLDNTHSHVNFASVKNGSVIEYHHFGNLAGSVSQGGMVKITVDLTSIDTQIPIRDERMKKELFDTEQFPLTTLSSKVDPVMLSDITPGKTQVLDVEFTLDLHGIKQKLMAKLQVTGLEKGGLVISTISPVDINAGLFGLDKGVEVLREIAKLNSILLNVPVNAHLVFVK